jgi:RNA polymerase sigma-70 factor (ECF subfamily)
MTPPDPRLDIEGLYRTHRNEVYRASLRQLGDHHDAEDVTQTAFLDAYKAILRGSKPDLPRPWLLAIAENVRRRRFRTTLRRPREVPLMDEALPSAEPPWRAQTEEIRAALSRLGESQRKVFLLRELGGFSYGEIATELDISVPAVQMLLFRARQKLRVELDRSGSVRVGGLIPVPHWLLGLADRVPAFSAAPRVAGLVAATVIAAGVGVTSDVSDAGPNAASPEQSRIATKGATPAQAPLTAPALKARTSPARTAAVAKRGTRAVPARGSTAKVSPTKGSATTAPPAATAAAPALAVVEGSAEPAAPIAPPTILGKDGPAPALALVPALPPVSQAPIVPVVVAQLPPLPELPVEEDVPALTDIPIVVQPPLPPALPGGVEVTIPEVASLRVGP